MVGRKKLFLMLGVLAAFPAAWAISASGAGGGKMSIKRVDDPVTVQGKALKPLLGKPIAKMAAHVYKGGNFVPVPFQIDERNAAGDWVFPVGKVPEKDKDNGALDANDELVFMARDAGDEAPAGEKPSGANAGVKITVTDPIDRGTGYVYLCLYDNPPPPSKIDYATYKVDSKWMWMIGSSYKIGTGIKESYFDIVMLKLPNGRWSPDIMDRYKTRGRGLKVPGMSEVPEEQAKAEAIGWIDGPVRVIRKTVGWLQVALAIKIHGEGSSQNLYYDSFFVVPLKLQIPKVPSALIKDFNMVQTLDFTKKFYGSAYYDQVNKGGGVIDGKMSPAEQKLDLKSNRSWFCVTGPKGSVFVRYVYPREMLQGIKFQGYYMDDANAVDAPEEEPGQANVGINMVDLGKMPPGSYAYDGYFCFPENFKKGDESRLNNMIDKPLQTRVESL